MQIKFLDPEKLGYVLDESLVNTRSGKVMLIVTHARDEHVITTVFDISEGWHPFFCTQSERLNLLVDADWYSHFGRPRPEVAPQDPCVLDQHTRMCDKYRTS